MKKFRRVSIPLLAVTALTLGSLAGCGNDSSSPVAASPQSGAVVQGPVQNSLVFADSLTTGTPFVLDSGEVHTFTDSQGNFTLPTIPTYSYQVVSQNGTDSLTGRKAIQLVAPSDARNVSALTTLVALTPAADQPALKAKLEGLGVKYDDDISKNVTSAALMLIKSVENTIDALTNALDKGATPLPASVLNDIQAKAAAAIASEMANPAVTTTALYTPADLKTTIGSAVSSAVTNIETTYATIITVPNKTTLAQNLADSTVEAVSTAVGTPSTSTSSATTEAAIITSTESNTLSSAVDTTTSTAESAVTVTVDTTKPTVTQTNFASGATNVVLDTVVQAKFSEALNAATVTSSTVTLKAGSTAIAGTIAYDPDTYVITFTPSAPLAGSTLITFTLTTGVKDVVGNAMATSYSLQFTTIAATVSPGSTGSTGSSGNTL